MILDAVFNFGPPAADITNSTAATVSGNVYDAGSAVRLFNGPDSPVVTGKSVITADANGTIKVELLGADDAGLTTNAVICGSTGIISVKDDGSTAIGTGYTVNWQIKAINQRATKRYYGLMYTLGGTNPDLDVSESTASVSFVAQTNLPGDRLATP